MASCVSLLPLGALAETETYSELMREGYSVVSSNIYDEDKMLILLTRGSESFICTLRLAGQPPVGPRGDAAQIPCLRLSGRADFRYNPETGELEPVN